MTASWRDIARQVLYTVTKGAILYNGSPNNWDTKTKQQVKRVIDAAYPFGLRKYTPYKVWLEERKETFIELGIEQRKPGAKVKARREPKLKAPQVSPGQLSLF
jgi:hypothetical protein